MENRRIAILFFIVVAFVSLLNIFFLVLLDPDSLPQAAVSFVGTIFLGLSFVAQKQWARWLLALRFGVGLMYSLAGLVELLQAQYPLGSMVGVWLLFMFTASAGCLGFLVFSRRINRYFAPQRMR